MYRQTYHCDKCDKEHEEEMLCCSKAEQEKETAADDSAVVEEIVCKADEVPEGTKKEVELRGRKILIINDGGKYHAVNGLCAHYNYPMVNGVYSKGKIRCPLHGACFNVQTGDIEDYPTFDSIHAFQVKKTGEDLVIKTTEKRLSSDRRTRQSWLEKTNEDKPIVVVGSGPAGESVVENLRLAGCKSPIIMLTKESVPPYDRVVLSKFMGMDLKRLREDSYYTENMIEVRTNSKVVALDAAAHTVTLSDKSVIPYQKLVLALGGATRKLPNKGGDLKGIYTLREFHEAKSIYSEAEGKDVVCVGASFIGMEAASALSDTAKSVTVIASTEEPLPAFGRDLGRAFRKVFEEKGVKILTKSRVDHLTGDYNGRVKEVTVQGGKKLHADVVVVGIGVEPDTKWLKNHDIQLDVRGFINVNGNFETNVKDVYAIGDVVSAPLPFWHIDSINVQHFQVAQRHGQLAAWSMMGRRQPGKLVPFFWTMMVGKGARFAGCSEDYDETYLRGNVEDFAFTKYYFKNGVVIAVENSGASPAAIQFLALCDQDKKITRDDVEKNTADDWAHLLK